MSRKAMQIALDALEKVITAFGSGLTLQQNAITALRQALETEQEPVAWITDGGKGELWWYQSSKFDEEGNLIGPNPDDIPLYTAPPKKEWVSLTDDAVFELADTNLYDGGKNYGVLAFAKAIEQALKEKNQ